MTQHFRDEAAAVQSEAAAPRFVFRALFLVFHPSRFVFHVLGIVFRVSCFVIRASGTKMRPPLLGLRP